MAFYACAAAATTWLAAAFGALYFLPLMSPSRGTLWSVRGTLHAFRRAASLRGYDDVMDEQAASYGRACHHMFALSLLISLPTSLMLTVRCGPGVASLNWPQLLDSAESIFPDGVELVINRSQFFLRPSARARGLDGRVDADESDALGASTVAPADPVTTSDSENGASDTANGEYICWSWSDHDTDQNSWCATAPQLEPIRLELPPLLHQVRPPPSPPKPAVAVWAPYCGTLSGCTLRTQRRLWPLLRVPQPTLAHQL